VGDTAVSKRITEDAELFIKNSMVLDKLKDEYRFNDIIGQSENMQAVFRLVEKVADCDSTILITGETGTGKGLVARAIHQNSKRKNKPFISINCGAIPENLLESELFGHVRGAFTGATASKQGKFELANGGTIFLDEIGDMSPDLQVKVLKVLEEGEFEQVGGSKTIRVDVRIIAATHRDLAEEVQRGNFRDDLFYRLYVIPMNLPSLRDRKSDIPFLVSYFLEKSNQNNNRQVYGISEDALALMLKYSWPGNVRELQNTVKRLVLLGDWETVREEMVTRETRRCNVNEQVSQSPSSVASSSDEGILTAKILQISYKALLYKIKEHGLAPEL